jgi:anaerobic magnesium-protoporphyrin IX monomethyl ester cyclase
MAEGVDILFINPGDRKQIYQDLGDEFPAIEPPVFAGLFATYVRGKGRSAAIYDAPAMGASAGEAARVATEDYAPKLIVIVCYGLQPSASTQNMTAAGDIARLIREAGTAAKIMMTGTHPSALPELTMQQEAVDFVCDLEGPVTILKALQAIDAKANDFSGIPSLWSRDGNDIVPPSSAEALLTDLDNEMPGIAWDLLPMEKYRAHNWHSFDHIHDRSPYAAIHTSLGCPYKCHFCCINSPFGKSSYRMWSPESVIKEIDHLVETYGVKNLKFVDEMFVLNKSHVLGICDLLIERDYEVNIWAYARVDSVQDEFLDKLKAAGVNWLCLGIESASVSTAA